MMAPAPADRFASYDELIRAIELASVDHMRPAGLWVRSMATFVDLLIALLIATALVLPIQLVFYGDGDRLGPFILIAYMLYATALVARNGRTLGQWLFELEVADTTTGGKPGLRRAAIRVVLPAGAPLTGSLINHALGWLGYELDALADAVFVAATLAVPIALVWASLRSVGKQTIWDKLSGTMVRYRTRRTTAI